MGKKSKLKQQRKIAPSPDQTEQKNDPHPEQNFVKTMIHQGYPMQQIMRSPEIPKNRPEPRL